MVQGLEYTIHRKEKYSLLANKSIAKTDLLVVKKKNVDQKNEPHFLPFKMEKKIIIFRRKILSMTTVAQVKATFWPSSSKR